MPRGTRRWSRHENIKDAHHNDLVAIVPDQHWLVSRCWCDKRHVAVPQYMVRECLTMSCGRSLCVGPDGEDDVGLYCTEVGRIEALQFSGPVDETLPGNICFLPPPAGRMRAIVRREAPRTPPDPPTVRERRDLVRAAWRAGAAPGDIAHKLMIRLPVVVADIQYMWKTGQLWD